MAGFGRTGKKMAVEHYGDVVPDIMCTAKGMSCGYTPIGAAIANDEVFDAIMVKGSGSFHHGHTYAGNPLSTGIACKVIEIMERENYVENCAQQGEYLMSKLQELYQYPIVGDIRGKGLMIGIEFVKDQKTKEPFETSAKINSIVNNYCLERGISLYPGGGSADGLRGDHTQITPPISITKDQVNELYDALEGAVRKTCEEVL
jgi:adenosylmethionine-8-amino-7-oxononanoate aminotransferase